MEKKNSSIRIISVICVLTLIILTIFPGCNLVGQTKEGGDTTPVVDDQGNELCCPLCKATDITDNGDGKYTCNICNHTWGFDQSTGQIDVVDNDGNVVDTLDPSAGYVSTGGSSSSGGSNSNSTVDNSYFPTYDNNYSSGGNTTGGNTSGGSSSTSSTTRFDYKQFVSDLNASIKRFGESVKFVYDEETESWTVVNADGKDTGLFGFKYSTKDKVFYTAENAWQRNFGYMETYDNFSGAIAISYDTIRVKFNYDSKEWMMQFWKGQYGLVLVGAELGTYNRKENATESSYYDCVTDEEKLNMSMKVLRLDPTTNIFVQLFERSPSKTWWLTGFTPGTLNAGAYVANEDATKKVQVVSTIDFDTPEQAQAFIGGLKTTTTILHNSPRRTRAINFVEVKPEEFDASTLTSKYALDGNGKTVYVSWR